MNNRLVSLFSNYTSIEDSKIATCANATLAIEGAIATSSLNKGNLELPSWTFAATAHAAVKSKHFIKFVDIDENWRSEVSSEADLLIDVLPFGDSMPKTIYPSNLSSVVIDAAASFDNLKNLTFASKIPQALIVSLHSTKLIGAGEGAIFITNDREWAKRFKNWTSFGFDGNRTAQSPGTNAKLSEYAAAIGIASFDHWKKIRESYVEMVSWAKSVSNHLGLETQPSLAKNLVSPYWIVKFSDKRTKEGVAEFLNKSGIQTRDWWESGCHKMPAFAEIESNDLSKTDDLAARTLGLPFHLFMDDEAKDHVAGNLEVSLAKMSSK